DLYRKPGAFYNMVQNNDLDFTHYFEKDEGCAILDQKDVTSLADREDGIRQCLVLVNWKKNDAMPDGEYATWIVINNTSDKSFVRREGNYFPTVFFDSPKAALAAAKADFNERLEKEKARVDKDNEFVKQKHERGFAQ
ncbi:MAG: hypothetical protein IJ521_03445, partial [Schwartzia sp.]|nr:hypothetical protein [Schwartzia sp. (in: firmicutes)]